jgi:phosphate:Na+ symporter
LIFLGYGFWISPDFKEISAGVAIFLFGMLALEEGFRAFSGGILEKVLHASTNKLWKSISFGFVTTAIMQSSSLVSVLTISFIGAGLIGLTQGIGIILGANIGTTTGAWLMAGFGLKVKISAYAMPMLVFGVILIFQKAKSLKGIGYVLAGLGFLFLGIHYMKEGFESFKDTIDLASFAVGGFKGLLIYIGIGVLATVVMQSSHATIILILAALSVGQITYENAIALTIGANIGTTITAVIGSLSSNIDGKRLAGAHLIFNVVTATITVAIFYQIIDVVNFLADYLGIATDNHTLRLAVFDSLFKVMGVVLFIPFVDMLVRFLERTLKKKETTAIPHQVNKAEFLNNSALELPFTTLKATLDESKRLLENTMRIIASSLGIDPDKLFSDQEIITVFADGCCESTIDIEEAYQQKLKGIYGEIVEFVIRAQSNMEKEYINGYHNIKLANRDTIEAVKMAEQLQHNLSIYLKSDNPHIKEQYIKMSKRIAKLLRRIHLISQTQDKKKAMEMLQKTKKILIKNDIIANGKLDKLIRANRIDHVMASSLMNDSAYTNNIIRSLIVTTGVLWIDPTTDIVVYREEIFRDKK